jgi:hypothetical protein
MLDDYNARKTDLETFMRSSDRMATFKKVLCSRFDCDVVPVVKGCSFLFDFDRPIEAEEVNNFLVSFCNGSADIRYYRLAALSLGHDIEGHQNKESLAQLIFPELGKPPEKEGIYRKMVSTPITKA